MFRNVFLSFLLGLGLIVVSCKKDDPAKTEDPTPAPSTQQASLKLEFKNMVGDDELVFLKNYKNAKGDTFNLSKWMYYISNVVVTYTDGSTFVEPGSYHLVDHSINSTKQFILANIPAQTISKINFMLGVDSLHNVSGAKAGDLDPTKGMFWTWTTGYIHLKMEGKSPVIGGSGGYTYHIGGFKGQYRNMKNFSIAIPGNVKLNVGALSTVEFKVDAGEMFKNPNLIDLSSQYYVMSESALAKTLADNYADMITFKETHN